MKKIIITLCMCLMFAVLFVGCGKSEKQKETEKITEILETVQDESATEEALETEPEETEAVELGDIYVLLNRTSYGHDGTEGNRWDYEYDSQGKKLAQILKLYDGDTFSYDYEYDENDLLVKYKKTISTVLQSGESKIYSDDETVYEYNSNNELISSIDYDNGEIGLQTTYEKQGDIIVAEVIDKNGNLYYSKEFIRNDRGELVIQKSTQFTSHGDIDSVIEYDKNGFTLVTKSYDSDKETLIDDSKVEYVYDENGFPIIGQWYYYEDDDTWTSGGIDKFTYVTLEDYLSGKGQEVLDSSVDMYNTIFEDENDTYIKNYEGTIIASYANGDFDYILDYGDGYYALGRDVSGYDSTGFELGILCLDGTWAREYQRISDYTYSNTTVNGETMTADYVLKANLGDTRVAHGGLCIDYRGDGVFTYDGFGTVHFISCSTGKEFNVDKLYLYGGESHQLFENGYGYVKTINQKFSGNIINTLILDINGVVADLGEGVSAIGGCSDGGFIYYADKVLKFFDCESGESTVIFTDSDRIIESDVSTYKFVNGQARITLKGADGNTYKAVIDKQGNFIEEPHI